MARVITEDHAAYSTVDEPASAEIAAFVEDDGTPLKPPPPSGDTFSKTVQQKSPKRQPKGGPGPVAGTGYAGSGAKASQPSPAVASKASSVRIPIELSKDVQEVEERSESSSGELESL